MPLVRTSTESGQHILVPSKGQRSWTPMHRGADVPHMSADVLGSGWLCSSLEQLLHTGGFLLLRLLPELSTGLGEEPELVLLQPAGCAALSFPFSGGTDPQALPMAYSTPAGCVRGCRKADKISVIRHRPSSKLG